MTWTAARKLSGATKCYFAEQLRWFERWLKDTDTGVETGFAGAHLRHGRRRRAAHARRPPQPRRPLARRAGVAARPHAVQQLLSACGRAAISCSSARWLREFTYDPSHPVPTIGASSSGLMELIPLGDGLDPFWGRNISPWLRLRSIVAGRAPPTKRKSRASSGSAAVSAARDAARRAGLPDAAART